MLSHGSRWHVIARVVLATVALAGGLAVTALAFGAGGTVRVGPVSATVHDYVRPLVISAVAACLLVAAGWRDRRWRGLALLLCGVIAAAGALAFARLSSPVTTGGDLAVGELYTALAADGRLLVGPYSRYGWHHPGPLYFYMQAPLYAVSGGNAPALYVGALLLNMAALVAIFWTAARHSFLVAASATGAILLLAWRVPRLLASPWTAHVPLLAVLAFLVLTASMTSGRVRLLPIAVVFGTLAVQSHIALAPAVTAAAAALVLVLWTSSRTMPIPSSTRVAALGVALVLWGMPLAEALTRKGGNIAALWAFFVVEQAEPRSIGDAFLHWSHGLAGILRPELELPWGSRVGLDGIAWSVTTALGQMLALAALAWRDGRRGRRFASQLAVLLLLASGVGLWACTRIRGEVRDHEIFWLTALGALNLGLIVHALLRPLVGRVSFAAVPVARAGAAAVLALALLTGVAHLRDLMAYERRRPERNVTLIAHKALREHLRAEDITRPLLVIDDGVWGETAGVVLRLYRDATEVTIAEPVGPMFQGLFPRTGTEEALIHLTRGGRHEQLRARPGNHTILEHHPVFINALRLPPDPAR